MINTRIALATAQKGSSSIADFFSKMKGLADEMASAGKKLDEEEVASYILWVLTSSTITARTEPITLGDLFMQPSTFEQRCALL